VLGHRVTGYLASGLSDVGVDPSQLGSAGGGGVPVLAEIPEPVRGVVQAAYGDGIADIFLVAAPFALLSLLIVLFFTETALRTSNAAPGSAGGQVADGSQDDGQHGQDGQDDGQDDGGAAHGRHAAAVEPVTGGTDHLGRHTDRRAPVDAHR